jgi:hypothetical protein
MSDEEILDDLEAGMARDNEVLGTILVVIEIRRTGATTQILYRPGDPDAPGT